jgi:hypothetical protein
MSRLRSLPLALVVSLALGALVLSSCGGNSGDQTTSFVGPWTFSSGTLTPNCPILGASAPPNFDLAGLNVTFAKVDDTTIRLTLNVSCVVNFNVSGGKGTVAANQACALDVPKLGMVSVAITSWTLTLTNDHIDCTIAGSAESNLCTAIGTATLVRGTTDGGPRDAPGSETASETGGTSDAGAGMDGADGGAPETGGETSSMDVAGEAPSDAGAEAGAEVADAPAAETD